MTYVLASTFRFTPRTIMLLLCALTPPIQNNALTRASVFHGVLQLSANFSNPPQLLRVAVFHVREAEAADIMQYYPMFVPSAVFMSTIVAHFNRVCR